jgi:hypothetical protein
MSSYISYPLDTNIGRITQTIYTFIKTRAPEWLENNNNLDTWIIQAVAREAGDIRGLASDVPAAIFRWFGKTLIGLPPQESAPAVFTATITVIDTLGYTIKAGAFVGVRDAFGNILPFQLQSDVVIAAGSLTSAVGAASFRAVTPGSASSNIGAAGVTVSTIDPPMAFVSAITMTAAASGGIEAEDNDEYQDRLARYLRLLSTRPILAADFATRASLITGVARAVAIDNYIPAFNDQQRLTEFGAPTGGTFTFTFNGQTTGALAYNITAAALKTAIEALSSVGAGNTVVTGGPLNTAPITIEFVGTLAGANQPAITVNTAGFTGGTSPGITVTNVRDGAAAQTAVEKAVTVASVDAAGANSDATTKSAVAADLQANRELGFIINVVDPTRTAIDVTFQAKALSGFLPATALANAVAAIQAYLSPASWGRDPRFTDETGRATWIETLNVRLYNIAQVIENSDGIDYVLPGTLTLGKNGGAQTVNDVVIPGPAALTTPGTILGTVT